MTPIQTIQSNVPPGVVDFSVGHPDNALLPLSILAQAATHRLDRPDTSLLQYGVEIGDGRFRRALAAFLEPAYGMTIDPDHLFITNGASQALDMICAHLTQPGDVIFVEEPTYFLALDILADYDLNLVPIPLDEQGLNITVLAQELRRRRPVFLYTIPTFHNPATVNLSAARRAALAALSREYDFLIVADEVYHLLDYTVPPPPPLASYDGQDGRHTILSLGSFSKILAPGLRLGWIQAAPDLLEPLLKRGVLISGGGLNPFTAALVHSAIDLGLQADYLNRLKETYAARASALTVALRQHLPPEIDFAEPTGGFYIWLRLPPAIDSQALLTRAAPQQVSFKPGPNFAIQPGLSNYARLCFTYYPAEQLLDGVVRLAAAIATF